MILLFKPAQLTKALIESLKKIPEYSVYVYGALDEIFFRINA